MFLFDFWDSKNPVLALTPWQSVRLLKHFQKICSSPWWTKPLMNRVCGSHIGRNWKIVIRLLFGFGLFVCFYCFGLVSFFVCFLRMNPLLSPGFELTPWDSTFGRFFNANLWVLLAPKHCRNSLRNSGRLEREREKRKVQEKEREKFLKGLANLSNLLTNVVWVPSLQWNVKPGKFLVIWGSAMNILHSSS